MTPTDEAAQKAPWGSRTLRSVLAGVLALALLASVAWLVIEVRDRSASDDSVHSDRDAVVLKARQWMQVAWNFGSDDLDEQNKLTSFAEQVQPLISTRFQAEFDEVLALLEATMQEQDFAIATEVDRIGVESIDPDRATVVVGGEQRQSTAPEPRGYTWRIVLVKVDGQWRVDSYGDIEAPE